MTLDIKGRRLSHIKNTYTINVGKNTMLKSHKNEIMNQKRTKTPKSHKSFEKKIFHTKTLLIFCMKMACLDSLLK